MATLWMMFVFYLRYLKNCCIDGASAILVFFFFVGDRPVPELTRRLERQVQESAATGCASGGTGIAAPPPAPRDLQEVFQRSSKQQVVAGGAADYSALEARLRG